MKLTAKHIMFILMCILLVLTIVMGAIVFNRVSGLVQLVMGVGSNNTATDPSSSVEIPSSSVTPPSSSEQETTAPHVHEFVVYKTISPACDTQGYTMYSCECGKNDIRDFVNPLGHNYGEETVVEATCETDGWTERTCSRCKQVKKENTVKAAHKFSDWTAAANNEQRSCSACNITEIRSLDTTQTWVLRLAAQTTEGDFACQKITVDLDGKDNDFTCEIYISTELTDLAFDYTDAGLTISYALAGTPQSYVVPAGTTAMVLYADGTSTTGAPNLTPDPIPEPDPEPSAEPGAESN